MQEFAAAGALVVGGRRMLEKDQRSWLRSLRAPVDSTVIRFSLGCLMLMDPGSGAGQTSSCPGIHVTILNIRHSIGTVDCALFDSPNGFPRDGLDSAIGLV